MASIFNRNLTRLSSVLRGTLQRQSLQELHCVALKSRGILKVSGQHSYKLLQGLVTNDVEAFRASDKTALYSAMLNSHGRVLFDVILYKALGEEATSDLFVECDKKVLAEVEKHLKMYKLRCKVDFENMTDSLQVWAVFGEDMENCDNPDMLVSTEDPRLEDLGRRVILPAGESPCTEEESAEIWGENVYHEKRAKLGVPEGLEEIPQNSALPLEFNLDFMKGVDFHKGCYLGQELTARTHHTGVIRKRVLPFEIKTAESEVEAGDALITPIGRSAGKVLQVHGQYGLGLVRLDAMKNGKRLQIKSDGGVIELQGYFPSWWPTETAGQ